MTDNTNIDKNSKLFQRFLLTKQPQINITDSRRSTVKQEGCKEYCQKQNEASSMNRCEKSQTEYRERNGSFVKEGLNKSAVREKREIKIDQRIAKDNKLVHNVLNIGNTMGLDQILKRAIERVRESRIQNLPGINREDTKYEDDSLEKLSHSKTLKQVGVQRETQTFVESRVFSGLNVQGSRTDSIQKISEQWSQKSLEKSKVTDSSSRIEQLERELSEQRQRGDKLSIQNQKMMKQVTLQVTQNEQLEKEVERLTADIRQLEGMMIDKDRIIKKYSDEANNWRSKHQIVTIKLHNQNKEMIKISSKIQELMTENNNVKKDLKHKEQLLVDMKVEMTKMKEQSQMAKQYLFDLTVKLYHSELALNQYRGEDVNKQEANCQQDNQLGGVSRPFAARKRQFSQPRTNIRQETQFQQQIRIQEQRSHKYEECPMQMSVPQSSPSMETQQDRIATLTHELSQLTAMKYVNGRIRRRKIQLQRQLQAFSVLKASDGIQK